MRFVAVLHCFTVQMPAAQMVEQNLFGNRTPDPVSSLGQDGLKAAIKIPLGLMRLGDQAWDPLCEAARQANIACASDIQVGARCLETGIWGAWQNVIINMTDITDRTYRIEILDEAALLADRAQRMRDRVLDIVQQRIDAPTNK